MDDLLFVKRVRRSVLPQTAEAEEESVEVSHQAHRRTRLAYSISLVGVPVQKEGEGLLGTNNTRPP